MKKFTNRILKFLTQRMVVVSVLIILQFALILGLLLRFSSSLVYIYAASSLISIIATLRIISRHAQPSYKIAWLIPILMFPIVGITAYLVLRGNRMTKRNRRKMKRIGETVGVILKNTTDNARKLRSIDNSAAIQSEYITKFSRSPLYANTETVYFPSGERMFIPFLRELKQAEKYIFLEYFIIAEGEMWDSIFSILKYKAANGVDVRIIYDDIGSMFVMPKNFEREMRSFGIKCKAFNKFVPIMTTRLNNRDHRKIAVIDGKVAFTGGINIADEYINAKERFGYWKDTAIMLRGDAAWCMTVMFLSMWDYLFKNEFPIENSYKMYMPQSDLALPTDNGFVQPYTDNPHDEEPISETVYLNMINRAERYIYITTPYLIIDYQMENALCTAAKSGIDVRIITPSIPDKFFVHEMTQSHYATLIKSGVKVYEFSEGFIHAKMFVCDGKYATVGTVNLDYRSLYLHFECGVWMYKTSAVSAVYGDFLATQARSKEMTLDACRVNFWRARLREVLAVLAPLC